MADSAVAVTAGSGTNIDTRTESDNGNHRAVVVLGDPSTTAGVATVSATDGLLVNLGSNNDVTVTGSVTADLGANNDVTVTGTVDLGATDNAVLDSIAAAQLPDGHNVTVDNASLTVDLGANNDVSLNAGTNAIGKLAANSGVDIGDVDVLTLPNVTVGTNTDSIDGAGAPSVDSYTTDDVNLAAATANQVVVAAPGASKQIWVFGLVGTVDADGSISIQDEDDTALSGVMPVAANGGFVMNPSGNFAMPWIKVATNKALEIDTLVCTFDGTITYAIVSV